LFGMAEDGFCFKAERIWEINRPPRPPIRRKIGFSGETARFRRSGGKKFLSLVGSAAEKPVQIFRGDVTKVGAPKMEMS